MASIPPEKLNEGEEFLRDLAAKYPDAMREIEAMFEQMQAQGARNDVLAAINATPEELGACALRMARAKITK